MEDRISNANAVEQTTANPGDTRHLFAAEHLGADMSPCTKCGAPIDDESKHRPPPPRTTSPLPDRFKRLEDGMVYECDCGEVFAGLWGPVRSMMLAHDCPLAEHG